RHLILEGLKGLQRRRQSDTGQICIEQATAEIFALECVRGYAIGNDSARFHNKNKATGNGLRIAFCLELHLPQKRRQEKGTRAQ
ncbi:MAG: hypothetical protein ACK57O_10275, partial [Planctomyces sp.]